MIGKLIGKAIGTVLTAPAIIVQEVEEAIEEVERSIDDAGKWLDGEKKP